MELPASSGAASTLAERRFFTVDQANRALPYVSRIVRDIRQTYRDALATQQRLELPMPNGGGSLSADYDRLMARLSELVDELSDVGVELKDYEVGLVDFPAMHAGREVCLCWKMGEAQIVAWHETDAGFAGRQSVETLESSED